MYDLFDNEIVEIPIEEICFLAICTLPQILSSIVQLQLPMYIINYGNLKCYQANKCALYSWSPYKTFLIEKFLLSRVIICECCLLFTDITLGLMNHQTPLITCYSSLIPYVGQQCFRRTPYYSVLQIFKEKAKADTKCEFFAVIAQNSFPKGTKRLIHVKILEDMSQLSSQPDCLPKTTWKPYHNA